MFEWIGKISDYTATWKLKKEANWRIKTGQSISLTDSKKDFAEEARQRKPQTVGTLAKVTDATRLAIISQKARGGKKLTPEELRLLKENDEALYQKAKKADDAREELKAALKRAKTKEAARRILMDAQLKVAIEAMEAAKSGAGSLPAASASGAGGASSAEAGRAAANDSAAAPEGGASGFSDGAAPALAGAGEAAAAKAAPAAQAGQEVQGGAASTNGSAASANGGAASTNGSTEAAQSGAAEKGAAHDGRAYDAGEKKPSFLEERVAQLKASYNRAMDELENAKSAKFDLDDTYIIVLRALADEWREFTSSKAWEKLPENEREAKLRGKHGAAGDYGRRGSADALLSLADSYKTSGKEELPQFVDLLAHVDEETGGAGFSVGERKIGGIDTRR
ncbi:hypothetical protein [Selenomonas sp. CM52]|uniref:hypothetical protein n=1 Tax=Selenomonas sp. CM52 TaxID=936381 RepID=UPI00027C3C72|nr:hypothetical protein [Selenomonas sp. CM52]EJU28706.1 hypothetical protein HMPREF1153_2294 [Selenomonas sp. CM52]